jgi:hypothetical protein
VVLSLCCRGEVHRQRDLCPSAIIQSELSSAKSTQAISLTERSGKESRKILLKTLPLIYKIQLSFNMQAMNKPKNKTKKII